MWRTFESVEVMNGWRDAPHCWWRYLLLPFSWKNCRPLGWFMFSAFGFSFFLMYRLSDEEHRKAVAAGRKLIDWAKKNGRRKTD